VEALLRHPADRGENEVIPEDEPLSHWITLACLGFEEDLHRLMAKRQLSRADLAKAVAVSPAFVSQVLGGGNNYTLKTMAKMARAVGAVLEVRLADEAEEVVRVVDLPTAARLDEQGGGRARPKAAGSKPVKRKAPKGRSE
jgi:transcriptional regulator with XRE-family HTH domain